jgi:hypothetical protein
LDQYNVSLEERLRQVLLLLDLELARFADGNKRFQEMLSHIHETALVSREDITDQLLSEVHQKAGILDAQQLRASFLSRHRMAFPLNEPAINTAIAGKLSTNLANQANLDVREGNDLWSLIPVQNSLPQVKERNGILIKLEALQVSAMRVRVHFHLQSTFLSAKHEEHKVVAHIQPFPLLTGIHANDDIGTVYTLEPTHHVSRPENSTQSMLSIIEFSPSLPLHIRSFQIVIVNILFPPDNINVSVTSAMKAQLIEGPWEFEFLLND